LLEPRQSADSALPYREEIRPGTELGSALGTIPVAEGLTWTESTG